MPSQELGIKDDVKVVTVDSLTGEIVQNIQEVATDHSSPGDSVDGGVISEIITSDSTYQIVLNNVNSVSNNSDGDGTVFVPTELSSNSAVSTIGEILVPSQRSSNTLSAALPSSSGGVITVPQVLRIDSNKSAQDSVSVLGKRPANSVPQGKVVNKVIITKPASASQPQAVPVQIQTVSAGARVGQPATSDLTLSPRTPTKTITISSQGIVSPIRPMTMTTTQLAGTPPKVPISKIPISPAKTPTKITMIPVSSLPGRSPQKIAPAGSLLISNTKNSNSQTTITMSPSKVLKQPGTIHVMQKPIQPSLNNAATVVTIPGKPGGASGQVKQVTIQPGNVQQIHVPGNKFQYIRLATPTSTTQGIRSQTIQTRPGVPPSIVTGNTGSQMKITIPAQSVTQMITPRPAGTSSTVQRIILPAAPNQQLSIRPQPSTTVPAGTQIIRSSLPAGTGNITQLTGAPTGTTFLSTGNNTQGVQGYALVPASYLSQIQQHMVKPAVASVNPSSTTVASGAQQTQSRTTDYVPIASVNPNVNNSSSQSKGVNGSSLDGGGGARPRKPCNCTKSQCLKLYCDCFANGEFCHNCNCLNCANNLDHEEERSRAIKCCLERNPLAFHPKIGKGKTGEKDRRHNKGCNCKRSGCLKNYCECYEAKIMCSTSCKCVGCKNFEESPERKTLMHLADAAEVRVQQQTAAKTKLSSQISDVPSRPVSSVSGERLPFSFVTTDVVEATCGCLLAQADESDRQKMPPVVQERMVIEEFGRCLLQIIESASRTKAPDPDDVS